MNDAIRKVLIDLYLGNISPREAELLIDREIAKIIEDYK